MRSLLSVLEESSKPIKTITTTARKLGEILFAKIIDLSTDKDIMNHINSGTYPGTQTKIRAASGDAKLTLQFFGDQRVIISDTDGGWIAARFGDEDRDGTVQLTGRDAKLVYAGFGVEFKRTA